MSCRQLSALAASRSFQENTPVAAPAPACLISKTIAMTTSQLTVETAVFESALNRFVHQPLFGNTDGFFCDSPYRRPVRPQDVEVNVFAHPLALTDLKQPSHLLAQRLLQNVYEQDLVFLPTHSKLDMAEMAAFYADDFRVAGQIIRPVLENYVFSWLSQAVGISGNWTLNSFKTWSDNVFGGINTTESALTRFVAQARRPKDAIRFFLIQCAGDFLSEASAMARNVLGNFGAEQSELFKILIDEYGYGVHGKKHSTIFEQLMHATGLSANVHHYWQFYTATSIALTNYFHYISASHRHFFRYLGALFYTEASLAFVTPTQALAVKLAFGDEVSTLYFDEHAHIDVHHGRMAFENLIVPAVRQYGEQILPDIVRGFEEFRFLQEVADEELLSHLAWHEQLAQGLPIDLPMPSINAPTHTFDEPNGAVSTTHTHNTDELFAVQQGEITLMCSPLTSVALKAGQKLVIPRGMLHGSVVTSERCVYCVTALD
jgi:hypothetical protein